MEKDDDPYDVLGVPYDASEGDIKKAYRKAALKYHPDRQHTEEDKQHAHDVFSKISGAYTILTDPVKRYDWKQANEHKMKGGSSSSSFTPSTTTTTTSTTPPPSTSTSSMRRPSTVTPNVRPASYSNSPGAYRHNQSPKSPHGRPRGSGVGKSPISQRRISTVRSAAPPPPMMGRGGRGPPPGRGRGPPPGRGGRMPAPRNGSGGASFRHRNTNDLRHSMHGTGHRSYQQRPSMRDLNGGSMHSGRGRQNSNFVRPMPKSPGGMRSPAGSLAGARRRPSSARGRMPAPPVSDDDGSVMTGARRRPSSVRGRMPAPPLSDDDGSVMSSSSFGSAAKRRSSSLGPSPAPRRGTVQVDRGPIRGGRKRPEGTQVQKKCHPPLETYDRLVRQHFGADYLEQSGKTGLFKKGKEIEAETLENCKDQLAITSISTKTTTEKKDGLIEVKTITKTKRVDGSVETDTKVSLVDKDEAKNLPKDLNLTIKRKVEMYDAKKEEKKREEEKKKAEKAEKKREQERVKEEKKVAKKYEMEERKKAEKRLEEEGMNESISAFESDMNFQTEASTDADLEASSTSVLDGSFQIGEDGQVIKKKKKKKKKKKSITEEGSPAEPEDSGISPKLKKKKKKKKPQAHPDAEGEVEAVDIEGGDDDTAPKKKKKKKKKKKSEGGSEELIEGDGGEEDEADEPDEENAAEDS